MLQLVVTWATPGIRRALLLVLPARVLERWMEVDAAAKRDYVQVRFFGLFFFPAALQGSLSWRRTALHEVRAMERSQIAE